MQVLDQSEVHHVLTLLCSTRGTEVLHKKQRDAESMGTCAHQSYLPLMLLLKPLLLLRLSLLQLLLALQLLLLL